MKDVTPTDLSRRQFLQSATVFAVALPTLSIACAAVNSSEGANSTAAQSVVRAADGPVNPSWQTTMAPANEPGEPMIISGTIYGSDGVTPLAGARLHVYHTDARGYYSESDGNGQAPQPRLKGWMKTNADGKYEFRTIKAAPYPGGGNPAHIHGSLSAPGYRERWIEEYWFEGDRNITPEMRSRLHGTGQFFPILTLKKDGDGTWRGVRDFRLEKN